MLIGSMKISRKRPLKAHSLIIVCIDYAPVPLILSRSLHSGQEK